MTLKPLSPLALAAVLAAATLALPGAALARTLDEAQGDLFQAEGLMITHQYQAAFDHYKALVAEFPWAPRVVEGYIHALSGLSRWDEVRTAVLSERQRGGMVLAYSRELVAADRALGRGDEALEESLMWWTVNPADRRTQAIIDTLLVESNHSESAVGILRKAAAKAPSHVGLQEMLVEALARSGRGNEARDAAVRADRARGGDGLSVLNLAYHLNNAGQRDEAVKTAERVMQEYGGTPRALDARLARDSWLRGTPRWEEAKNDLEALVREHPGPGPGLQAEMLLAEGEVAVDPAAARARAQEFAQRYPQQAAEAWKVIAEANLAQGLFSDAAAAFGHEAETRTEGDERRTAEWNQAESYFYGALWDSATEAYRRFAEGNLRDGRSQDALSRMLLIDDASQSEEGPLAVYAHAAFLARQSPAAADTALAEVTRKSPRSIAGLEALFQRAELKRAAGDDASALNLYLVFADSTIHSSRTAEALFRAAEIYEVKRVETRRALDLYAEVVTRYPSSWLTPEARKRVEKLRRESGS